MMANTTAPTSQSANGHQICPNYHQNTSSGLSANTGGARRSSTRARSGLKQPSWCSGALLGVCIVIPLIQTPLFISARAHVYVSARLYVAGFANACTMRQSLFSTPYCSWSGMREVGSRSRRYVYVPFFLHLPLRWLRLSNEMDLHSSASISSAP